MNNYQSPADPPPVYPYVPIDHDLEGTLLGAAIQEYLRVVELDAE